MSSAAAAANRALGHRPRPHLPARRPRGCGRRARRRVATSPHDAATRPAPRRGTLARRAGRGRPAGVGDRRAHRRRRRRPPAAGAGHRPRRPARPAPRARRRGAGRRRATSPSAPRAGTPCAASVAAWWPERAERCPASRATCAATRAGSRPRPRCTAAGAYVLTGRGVEQSPRAPTRVSAGDQPGARARPARPAGLRLRLPDRAGQRPGRSRARPEVRPAARLPLITDPAARAHVAAVWGVDPDDLPGAGRAGRRAAGPARPRRAARAAGARRNPVVSAPRTPTRAEALGRLDLLVVATSCPSETARLADVVLPVTQWAEEEGTMTTSRAGWCAAARRSPRPAGPAGAVVAGRAGPPLRPPASPTTPARSSTSWPGPAPVAGPTTRRSATSGSTPGSAVLAVLRGGPPGHAAAVPRPLPDRRRARPPRRRRPPRTGRRRQATRCPFYLVTGRLLPHYQSGAQTRRVAELVEAAPAPLLEIHPVLADTHGVADGDAVRLTSARGELVAPRGDRRHPARTPSSCRSTGPASSARTC